MLQERGIGATRYPLPAESSTCTAGPAPNRAARCPNSVEEAGTVASRARDAGGWSMDRERFDALARLLATTGSRRAALGVLLGAGLFGQSPDLLAKPGKGKGKDRGQDRKRRGKRGRNDRGDEQDPGSAVESGCGTKQCDPPEPGSTRSGCDFNGFRGASFAGQDLHGSVFRRIDGRGTSFAGTDARGTVFAEACLRSASFRGARLGGSTWGGACLVDADFTGADLGGDAGALSGALLCRTVMPNGTVNNRDCGRDTEICRSSIGGVGPGPCTGPSDCQDLPCRTKACTDGNCVYEPVSDGPSPNGLCDTRCCGRHDETTNEAHCCPASHTVCTEAGRCCRPLAPGDCGLGLTCAAVCPANCNACIRFADGNLGCGAPEDLDCRPCSSDADCPANAPVCISATTDRRGSELTLSVAELCRDDALLAACARVEPCCTPETCPNGCCTGDGRCVPSRDQACGTGGAACKSCGGGSSCSDGRCACSPQSCLGFGCCAADGTCQLGFTNENCGPNGGTCTTCGAGQVCRQQQCQPQ